MSIGHAIKRAYEVFRARKYDTVYFAVDIHGTIVKSNCNGIADDFYSDAIYALKYLSSCPEIKIILWSSCFKQDYQKYIELLKDRGIRVDYFNENPECPSTKVGNFDSKFYFSVLIDDKAGFDPEQDWFEVESYTMLARSNP